LTSGVFAGVAATGFDATRDPELARAQ
jgi:hypothetical protein